MHHGLHLYFTEDFETSELTLTIPVEEFLYDKYNLTTDPNTYKKVIADQDGIILANIPEGFTARQINNFFYELTGNEDEEDNEVIYRIDSKKGFIIDKNIDSYTSSRLDDNLLKVQKDEHLGAIDGDGKTVFPFIYNSLEKSKEEDLIIGRKNNNQSYILYDLRYKEISSGTGYIHWYKDGLAVVNKPSETSSYRVIIDNKGNIITKEKYSFIHSFSDGLAMVHKNDKLGYINKNGEEVIPTIYDSAENFSDGFACVKKNGKAGYINKEGKVVIPFIYEDGDEFYKGVARVKNENDEYGLINKNGDILVPLKKYSSMQISVSYENKTYYFDGKPYDSSGQEIKE